jgi:hypothetical protein
MIEENISSFLFQHQSQEVYLPPVSNPNLIEKLISRCISSYYSKDFQLFEHYLKLLINQFEIDQQFCSDFF